MKTSRNQMFVLIATLIMSLWLAGCSENPVSPPTPEVPEIEIPDDPEDPGDNQTSYQFPGFEDITLFAGAYWQYSWQKTGTTNGSSDPVESGQVRIELVDQLNVTLNGIGSITLFEMAYSVLAGNDDLPFSWNAYPYLGVKDGVFVIASPNDDGTWASARLFDPRDGATYVSGFIGYFSSSRPENVYTGTISNSFIDAPAVVVDEPFYKPQCERIAGVEVCDDTHHDYDVKEYWLPGVGFGGWYRSGSSVFTGGGYYDTFQSTITVGLTDTNLN